MSTSRSTDKGDYVLVETGEPTVEDPSVWISRDVQWKPGTPGANRADIEVAARQALAANKAFVASTPTAAQTTAQVKALSRQVNGLVRVLLNQFDAAD